MATLGRAILHATPTSRTTGFMEILFLIALAVGAVVALLTRGRTLSRVIAWGSGIGAVVIAGALLLLASGVGNVGGELLIGLAVVVGVAVVVLGVTFGMGVSLGSSFVEEAPAGAGMPLSEPVRLRKKFVSGEALDAEDVMLLVHGCGQDRSLAMLRDRVRGDSLLHWCVRLDLPEHAARLLDQGADAEASNGQGRRPLVAAGEEFIARMGRARAGAAQAVP